MPPPPRRGTIEAQPARQITSRSLPHRCRWTARSRTRQPKRRAGSTSSPSATAPPSPRCGGEQRPIAALSITTGALLAAMKPFLNKLRNQAGDQDFNRTSGWSSASSHHWSQLVGGPVLPAGSPISQCASPTSPLVLLANLDAIGQLGGCVVVLIEVVSNHAQGTDQGGKPLLPHGLDQ